MTEQMQNSPSNFWQGLGRFMRGLVRLVLFALIVAIIVAAIYYAVPYAAPYIYNFTALPMQNSRVLDDHLQRTHPQMQEDLNSQLADQRERIAQLETDLAAVREARSELQSQLDQQAETIATQATVQAQLEANFDIQAQDTSVQTGLEARLDTQAQTLTSLAQSVDMLDTSVTDLDAALSRVEQAVAGPELEPETTELQQLLILQAGQGILKARLHLSENNPGQAQLALEQTALALTQLESLNLPEEKTADLAEIQAQLETVITAIEDQPFIVTQELEILWRLLQRFVSGQTDQK